MKAYATMMNATGVLRPVTTARSTSAIAMPPTQVDASRSQRFGHVAYRRSVARGREPSEQERPEHGEIPGDPRVDVVALAAERDEQRERERVDCGCGEHSSTLHGVANIAGRLPAPRSYR